MLVSKRVTMWPPQKKQVSGFDLVLFYNNPFLCAKDLLPSLESFVWIFGEKSWGKLQSTVSSNPSQPMILLNDWIILDYIVDWSFSYDLFKGWYCKIWKICASSRIQGTRGLSFNCNRLRRCNGITWAPVVQQHHRMRPLRWSCLRHTPWN